VDRPTPEDYQPTLTGWSHAWRLGLCVVISGLAWWNTFLPTWQEHRGLWVLDLAAGVVSFVLVLWRRRHPLGVALATNALLLVSATASGPATLAAVSLASRQRLAPIVAVGLVGLVASQGYLDTMPSSDPDPFWLSFTFNVVITVAIMGWGMFIGSRRQVMWTLHQRALRAEEEQELRAEKARADERARIAREMHDVLAHRISQVSMHAGALAFRDDLGADVLRRGIGDIKVKCNEALDELRAVLGVLRDTDTGELLDRPQPTYSELPRLVAEARDSGMSVELEDQVADLDDLPGVVGRAVYRIVQEGITNARKHAPGATLSVRVTGSPDAGVDVWLRNPLGFHGSTTPGAGLGLVGLRERAELRGGHLEQRVDDGVFELHAWLPWAA
jgi:signal transduction histidine kinase